MVVIPDAVASDANGENKNQHINRPPAIWLSDLTRAGTKRLGHIARTRTPQWLGNNITASINYFDGHLQMGDTLYLLGRVTAPSAASSSVWTVVGAEAIDPPLRLFAVDLNAAHIPHTSVPDAEVTSGGVRQLSSDSPFLVSFGGYAYYRNNGDLFRTNPSGSDQLIFDTESGGTIAGGSASPILQSGKLYFVARIGGTDSGRWFAYSHNSTEGTSAARVAFLGVGEDVAPRLLRPGAFSDAPSLIANDNIYFLDDTVPTFSTALSLTEAGETNALFSFVPSEHVSYSWVVTESATAPSSHQLRTAFDDSDSSPVANNLLTDQLSLSDSSEAFEASGLTSGTAYHLHLVLIDSAGNESEVVSVAFTTSDTGGDVVLDLPPELSSPLCVTRLTHSEVSLIYTPSEASTAHWVLVPFSEPTPSPAQVVSGVRADGSAANSGTQTISDAVSQTLTLSSDLTSSPPHVIFPSEPGMDTECRVYVVLQDAGGNSSPLYTTYFTTQEDNTSERILTADDFDVALSGTTATATFTARDEDFDELFWVSLSSDAPPATRRFILDGTTFDGLSVPSDHSGSSLDAPDADATGTFSLTNLEVGLSYTLYFTANTGAGVLNSDGSTPSDDYLPVQSHTFSAGAPFLAISGVVVDDASRSASVSFTTPISGDYYWLVQGSSLPFLSGSQIFSGLNANGVRPSAGLVSTAGVATDVANPNTFSVEELPLSGDYCVYVTIRSSDGVLYHPEASPFSYTADGTRQPDAPHFAFGPSVSQVSYQTASVLFTPTSIGSYHWILQESSTDPPTTEQIVAGQDGSGNMATAGSTAAVSLTDLSEVHIDLSALTPGTSYTAYIVLSNAAGANHREAVSVSFVTDAISLVATPTLIRNPGDLTVVAARFQADLAGMYCWVALPVSEDIPDVEAIANSYRRGLLQPSSGLRGLGEIPTAFSDVNLVMRNLIASTRYRVLIALSTLDGSVLPSDFLEFSTESLALVGNLSVSTVTDPLRVRATFRSNFAGEHCWVVLPSGESAPSTQAIANSYRRERLSSFSGRGSISAPNANVNFQAQNLLTSTGYTLYLVLSHGDASFAGPFSSSFRTNDMSVDITQAASTSDAANQASVAVTSDVAGVLCWLVLPQVNPMPTVSQLRLSTARAALQSVATLRGGPAAIASTTPTGLMPEGLTEGTAYTVYVVVVGANGSLSAVVSRNFTHSTTPMLTNLRADEVTDTEARVRFEASWGGKYCWVALLQSDVGTNGAPSATQVKDGQNGIGEPASVSAAPGGIVFDGTEVTFRPSGLSSGTAYRIYVALRGPHPTSGLGPVHDVALITESAMPTFVQEPIISSITTTSAEVSFTPAGSARYCWVFVGWRCSCSDPQPSAARRGQHRYVGYFP